MQTAASYGDITCTGEQDHPEIERKVGEYSPIRKRTRS